MPAPPTTPVAPHAAAVLRRIELTVLRRLDGLLQGDYRGLVPGQGSEIGESRPYVAGDDIRRIDWNVSARSMQTHVRESIAERELETWLLIDRSPSLDFGTAATTKAQRALEAAGALGFLTSKTGNRVGAVVVDERQARVHPARGGRAHLLSILRSLVTPPAAKASPLRNDPEGRPTDLAAAVSQLVSPPRRRGLMIIVSDFLGEGEWYRPVRALTSRHDVIAVEIVDPRELELPSVGALTVVDPETGRTREVATTRRTRQRYADAAAAQRRAIADELRRSGAAHLVLRTDRDWVIDLVQFVHHRRALQGAR